MHITGCLAEHNLQIAALWISTNDSGLCCTQLPALQGRHQLLQRSVTAPALVSSQKEYQLTSMMNH